MTDQLKAVRWTELAVAQQRRLIAVLARLAYRHLAATTQEDFPNECDNPPGGYERREDSRSPPRSLGGGVREIIHGAADDPSPGVDPAAIRPGGTRPGTGVAPATGIGD